MKKKPSEFTQEEWNEINSLEYSEKLKRWRELELEFDGYLTTPDEDSVFPHKTLASIIPDSVDKFDLYYHYKVDDYKRQFPFLCDFEMKKNLFQEQLRTTPNPKECIEYEVNLIKSLIDSKKTSQDNYFLKGYDSCLRGLPITFNKYDQTGEFWRILFGHTTCLFYSYLQNLSIDNILQEGVRLQWSGDHSKSELSEIIYSLSKMKVIKYRGRNDNVTLKDLQQVFEELFNQKISSVYDLLRNSTTTFKRMEDPKDYFTYKLFEQVKNYNNRT